MGPTASLVVLATRAMPVVSQARLLVNGDYLLDADGHLTEVFDVLDQEAAIRLGLVKGSIVGEPTLGNGVVFIASFTTTSAVQIAREVELALAPMVDRGDIKDVLISATPYVKDGTAVARYAVTFRKTGRVRT